MTHMQICKTEFVVWGRMLPEYYSGRGATITPSLLKYGPFALPTGAFEYGRKFSWGWRFRGVSEASPETTPWSLAETREECIERARKFVRNELEHEPAVGRAHNEALTDIREYADAIM